MAIFDGYVVLHHADVSWFILILFNGHVISAISRFSNLLTVSLIAPFKYLDKLLEVNQ